MIKFYETVTAHVSLCEVKDVDACKEDKKQNSKFRNTLPEEKVERRDKVMEHKG